MIYLRKIPSLKELSSIGVAVNLCQDISFKEVVLCLEKPTYGALIFGKSMLTTDLKKLSTWYTIKKAKMKTNARIYHDLTTLFKPSKDENVKQWYLAIDKQCESLTKGIPNVLRCEIYACINRIALEYLSYCWQQELLFGISRYCLINIISRDDWTGTGRLDEKKIAVRLLEDERLTVSQKTRIAWTHCFPDCIPRLKRKYEMQLKPPSKQMFDLLSNPYFNVPKFNAEELVSTWSYYMNAHRNLQETQEKIHLMLLDAIRAGYETILMQCWKTLKKSHRQHMVISMALQSLHCWQSIRSSDWKNALILDEPNRMWPIQNGSTGKSRLPSHYCELLRFFLLDMNEEQQLTFFQLAFQTESVLQCFLDWPFQDEFLPTIIRLWGIIPENIYVDCLLKLAHKYSGYCDKKSLGPHLVPHYEKENSYYDYLSLLWSLWDETPENYKQYVFSYINPMRNRTMNDDRVLLPLLLKRSPFKDKDDELFKLTFRALWEETPEAYMWKMRCFRKVPSNFSSRPLNEGMVLLLRLLKKSPYQEKDEALFKRIWRDVPQTQKIELMYYETGRYIFSTLITKEKWLFLNWLLEDGLPNDKIPDCKKQFIQSRTGRELCLSELVENRAKWLEEFINWSFETDEEKTQFKYELVSGEDGLHMCTVLLSKGKFHEVENIMNICLSLNEMTDLDVKQKTMEFKKALFFHKGAVIHSKLVFYDRQWDVVKDFYSWFSLSPQEITRIKKKTLFIRKNIRYVQELLYLDKYAVLTPLFWCLTDGEIILELMNEIEKGYTEEMTFIKKEELEALRRFLMKQLIENFGKEVENNESMDWL